jgi:hypothetical protein
MTPKKVPGAKSASEGRIWGDCSLTQEKSRVAEQGRLDHEPVAQQA